MNYRPELISALKTYNRDTFMKDLMAGVIVSIVALPLAIAFGIASGVTPEKGLITAVIAGFLCAVFGGSSVQVSGPAGSFIVIVYGVVQQFGVEGLAIATFLAGVILVLMGVFKIGAIIRYIPYSIVVGFTSGIALTIFATQIKDLFGMQIANLPVDFLSKWKVYAQNVATIDFWSLGIGVASILIIVITPKLFKKVPGSLVAIVVITLAVYLLRNYAGITSIETIGDRFEINASLPKPQDLGVTLDKISVLFSAAFTIAILVAIESLLSATVADGVTGDKHHSNTELIGQGIANIVAPIFGGIPATGAIARTMTNINNGGKTPIAAVIHAVLLLFILLFLGNLSKHIPMACLAGVLVIVSYHMSEWRTFKALMKSPKSDVAVLLTTFFLTVVLDLTIAIQVGLLLAVVMFVRRISQTTNVSELTGEIDHSPEVDAASNRKITIPQGVEVYEIDGPFFFGIATKFDEQMKIVGDAPDVRIIRMRKVPFIDSTGIHNLEILYRNSKKENIHIILSGVNSNVRKTLEHSHLGGMIGEENICSSIGEAIEKSKLIVRLKRNK